MPVEFTDKLPPFAYSHNDLSATSIDEDPIGCRFPKSTQTARIHARLPEYIQFAVEPGHPTSFGEYVKRGWPQLGLRISSFKDATLVGLTWPHTVMDGSGKKELLAAWSLVLAGREQEVPTLIGASRDVAWDIAGRYADDEIGQLVVQDQLTGLARCRFIAKLVWRSITAPAAEVRTFYAPTHIIAGFRQEAIDQLPDDPKTGKRPFLSEGDIVAAWLLRTVVKTEPQPSQFLLVGALNARNRVPELQQGTGVYVQNLISLYYAQFPSSVTDGALATTALSHRLQVAEQATEHQLVRHFMNKRSEIERKENGDSVKFYCGEDDRLVFCNNLSGLRIAAAADFTPAVLPNEDGSYSSGKAVYYHFQSFPVKGAVPRNSFVIFDKDSSGYWIGANISKAAWAEIMHDIGVTEVI